MNKKEAKKSITLAEKAIEKAVELEKEGHKITSITRGEDEYFITARPNYSR